MTGPLGTPRAVHEERPSPLRLEFVDGIRALAACFVVVHHALQLSEHPTPTQGAVRRATQLFQYGHYAVTVFIVVSGFCLMLPVVRADLTLAGGSKLFFLKRARRILPPYYFALVVALAMAHLTASQARGWLRPTTVEGLITHLLLLHNLSLDSFEQINPVFWSIAVEWQIYFAFPALILCWRRVGGVVTTLGTLLLGYLVLFALRNSSLEGLTPHYYGLFAVGMGSAAIAFSPLEVWSTLRRRLPWTGISTVSVASLLVLCSTTSDLPLKSVDLAVGLGTATMLIAISKQPSGPVHALLSCKPVVFVGAFAYSLYLVHLPVLWLLCAWVAPPTLDSSVRLLRLLCTGLPLSIAVSYGFYLLCERPFIPSKRSSGGPLPLRSSLPVQSDAP